ncbi:MAG: AraC family transcriptional regulator [Clostridiales bacterium]|nr:AraC family transcriptional regulator [Clostridiales bacterium]
MNGFNGWKKDGFKDERLIVLPIESFPEYVSHPQIRRLYLTDVGFFPRADRHYRERTDGIEEYIFFYCMEGKGTIRVEEKTYTLRANEAFCIPRYAAHVYYACEDDPWSILWVHFKGEDAGFFPLEDCCVVRFASERAANRMRDLFNLLFDALDGTYTMGNFIYISQVLSLILAETYDREKTGDVREQSRHMTEIIRYMYGHLGEALTLEGLSRESGLSQSYLNVIFRKHTQHSPMDFFIRLKMQKACRLLRTTDRYIYEIAQELGYTDPYYFSRIFKKVTGISPKQYKNSEYIQFQV